MTTTQIGAQLYTVRSACKADFAGTLKKVAALGYRAVQISGYHGKTAAEIRRMCSDRGLEIMATHVSLAEFESGLDAVLRDHDVMKCRHIAIPWLPPERRQTKEDWLRLAELMESWARILKARGFVLMHHNHAFELETKFDGQLALDLLFENAPTLQSELDTYWLWKGGVDPAAYLARFKNRAPMLHLKDADRTDGSFAEVGSGLLDWGAILRAARQCGTLGYLVEQDTCKRDPFDCLKTSLEFLKSKRLR